MGVIVFEFASFTLSEVIRCGAALRSCGGADRMEEISNRVVHYLYNSFIDRSTNERSSVAVNFYKTCRYSLLDTSLRDFVHDALSPSPVSPDTRGLVLLASVGTHPASHATELRGQRVLPLTSPELAMRFPLMAQLALQLGLPVADGVRQDTTLMLYRALSTYNVVYLAETTGSQYYTGQETLDAPYEVSNVKSILGFGGVLPSGDLFAVMIFSCVFIPIETARMFNTLALCVNSAILPYDGLPDRLVKSRQSRDIGSPDEA